MVFMEPRVVFVIFEKKQSVMEALLEMPEIDFNHEIETEFDTDVKMSSRLHAYLQTHISYLLELAYANQYTIFTELDLDFASGKTRPDLCIFPRTPINWLADDIVVQDVPLTTIEILSPCDGPTKQNLTELIERIYAKHFPAGVKSVWLVIPPLELITVFLPNQQKINVIEGILTDPATGLQLNLTEVFRV